MRAESVEPLKSYILGQWSPGKSDYPTAFQVVRRMLRAHVLAYHEIHARRPDAMVSVAKHALALTPCNPRSRMDRLSVGARTYLFNHLFLDAGIQGTIRPGRGRLRDPEADGAGERATDGRRDPEERAIARPPGMSPRARTDP